MPGDPLAAAKGILQDGGYYNAMGKVAAAWASVELNIDHLAWMLAGVQQPVGACFTAQIIGPAKRFDAVIALVRLFNGSPELIDAIQKTSGRASGLGEERNRMLHDAPFADLESKKMGRFQITARKELKFGLVEVTIEDMAALLTKIEKLIEEIKELQLRVRSEIGPGPRDLPKWPVQLEQEVEK